MIACVWRCVVCCGHTMLIIKQYTRKVDLLEQVLECGMRLKSIKVEMCATVHTVQCATVNCAAVQFLYTRVTHVPSCGLLLCDSSCTHMCIVHFLKPFTSLAILKWTGGRMRWRYIRGTLT